MRTKLAKLILAEKSEVLSGWIKRIKAMGGSYAQTSKSELLYTTGELFDALMEVLDKNNFLKLRMFIERLSQMRSSRGFRVSEVQHACYLLYNVLEPMIEQWEAKEEAKRESLDRINSILIDMVFELSDSYCRKLNETVDKYCRDIENANLKLKETSITDELTSCYNQRYFYNVLDAEISRARRYGRPLSMVMFDIDHFKKVNDKFGHLFGDEILKGIGNILMKSIRTCDTAFRYGGEEFSIILPETTKERAFITAQRIRKKISHTDFKIKKRTVKVTVSAGISDFDRHSKSNESLVMKADKALYMAKRQGRNRAVVSTWKR